MAREYEARSDAELLRRSGRDPEAFGVFYDRHAATVLAYFQRRTACAESAADLTAETFATAFRSRRRYRDTGVPAIAWVLGIARHLLADSIRNERIEDRARRRLGLQRVELDDEALRRIEELADLAPVRERLDAAGIDAEVQALPSTPDYVGRWMGYALGREAPPRSCDLPDDARPDLECANPPLLGGDDVRFGDEAFQIRRDAIYLLGTTRTTFYVGREPEPGEKPVDSLPRGTDVEFLYPAVDTTGQGTSAEPGEPRVK
jgi:DNA-directed RNA polymerase specialized sigma24 family protein